MQISAEKKSAIGLPSWPLGSLFKMKVHSFQTVFLISCPFFVLLHWFHWFVNPQILRGVLWRSEGRGRAWSGQWWLHRRGLPVQPGGISRQAEEGRAGVCAQVLRAEESRGRGVRRTGVPRQRPGFTARPAAWERRRGTGVSGWQVRGLPRFLGRAVFASEADYVSHTAVINVVVVDSTKPPLTPTQLPLVHWSRNSARIEADMRPSVFLCAPPVWCGADRGRNILYLSGRWKKICLEHRSDWKEICGRCIYSQCQLIIQ